jgi:putative restriction endonuclease
MSLLSTYVVRLTRLQVAAHTVDGARVEAPYKPALLLAVLEGVEEGLIRDNRIAITPELIAAFKAYCQLLSAGPAYAACPFQLPFFHLQSSGFWHLQARPGRELLLTSSHSVKSFAHLREVIATPGWMPHSGSSCSSPWRGRKSGRRCSRATSR